MATTSKPRKKNSETQTIKFASWVSDELKQHHAEQASYEEQNQFEFSIAEQMVKLLQSPLMNMHWDTIRKGLQNTLGMKADDVAVYSLIGGALATGHKLNTERLAMSKEEKSELVDETLAALRTLKKNFRKIGKPDLAKLLPEKDIRSALDVFDRLGKLGNQKNQNAARDVCCYALVSCFRSRFGKPIMPQAAGIVATLFGNPRYGEKSAASACEKVGKAFTVRPLLEGVDYKNEFNKQ